MIIKELPPDERPRERLMEQGASALSPAELLAILIGSGNTEESAVQLMQRLLKDCGGSLKALSRLSLKDLTSHYKGLGPAKAVTILAACELGKRRMMEMAAEKRYVTSSVDIYNIMYPRVRDLAHEECHALYLRTDNSLEGTPFLVSKGGIASTQVDVRLVVREALIRQIGLQALYDGPLVLHQQNVRHLSSPPCSAYHKNRSGATGGIFPIDYFTWSW